MMEITFGNFFAKDHWLIESQSHVNMIFHVPISYSPMVRNILVVRDLPYLKGLTKKKIAMCLFIKNADILMNDPFAPRKFN